MNRLVLLLTILLSFPVFSQTYETVTDVPNPKQQGGYVANPDGILRNETTTELNYLLAQLEERDSFQVAVVCLQSIGSQVPKDFATELFNEWGVGHSDKEDGLLILFVADQRRIEFETGYGMETVLTDLKCDQIMVDHMIPSFRNENYDAGFIKGLNEVSLFLKGKKIDPQGVRRQVNFIDFEDEYVRDENEYRHSFFLFDPDFWLPVIGWHLLFLIAFLIVLIIARTKNDPYKKYHLIRYFAVWIWFLFFPLAHIFLFFLSRRLKDRYRNAIRFSGKTGEIMHKLSESEEDKHLNSGQITEEIVRSVDYDVWITDTESDVTILPYRPFFSSYTKCPKCGFSTYYKEYDRTVVAATTYSSGTGERKHTCAHCKHTVIKKYTIPRISKSSTTSSGGWSGGGSSGGSWSGGGSSGGSWGGGHSGGGGAGRSW